MCFEENCWNSQSYQWHASIQQTGFRKLLESHSSPCTYDNSTSCIHWRNSSTMKYKYCHYLLAIISFPTCMTFFTLWDTKGHTLMNVWAAVLNMTNICDFYCVSSANGIQKPLQITLKGQFTPKRIVILITNYKVYIFYNTTQCNVSFIVHIPSY